MSLADPAPDYGAVTEGKAPLLNAGTELKNVSEFLSSEDRSVLSFHHVSYSIHQRKFGIISAGRKHILNDLSGLMEPGLNAIMGPTGGGKTSLLDILAGRKSSKGVTGEVLINGQRLPKNFKCASGYVVQENLVMGTLTVRENLSFSAALRLPSHYSFKQRKEKVDNVIEELGLTECQNTMIGTEFVRGVSGGERKRCNIGIELIISPRILYLDEPTTGLDATTATSVVQLLKTLSLKGHTIILSIHQPRYSIFKLFDSVTLLSKGDMVYHGPANRALDYFSAHGYECEEHDNPADFFLDVIIQNEEAALQMNLEAPETLQKSTPVAKNSLAAEFKSSAEHQEVMKQVDLIADDHRSSQDTKKGKAYHYSTSFPWQLVVLSWRSWLNVLRNPMTYFIQVVFTLFFSLMIGSIYFQLRHNVNSLNDRVGAIFLIVMNQAFGGNQTAIELFIKQRAQFIHENASGFYRVSAYFLAKVSCDLIPFRIIPVIFYSVIVYFMIGFQVDAAKFFTFMLTLSLASSVAASIIFAISALVRQRPIAMLLTTSCFIVSMLFGGFFINLSSLSVWLSWLQYLSLFKYAVAALSVNELNDVCLCDPDALKFINTTPPANVSLCSLLPIVPQLPCVNGTQYLENEDFLAIPLWYNELALAVMIFVALVWGYINLRIIKKEK